MDLTAEAQDAIISALKDGNYPETAARSAGVSLAAFYSQMEQGEADEEHDVDSSARRFREAVLRAAAEAEVAAIKLLRAAMKRDWRAVQPWLERRYPDRWARRDYVEANVNSKADVEVTFSRAIEVVPDADRRVEVARILQEALGDNPPEIEE